MAELAAHRAYLDSCWQELQAAPLSRQRAMLVAYLVATHVDRLFAPDEGSDDILQHRAAMAAGSAGLARVMALCGERPDMRLATEAVAVPIADYGGLSVEDFMVSLYNDHTVQRLVLVGPDGARHDMVETLRAAIAGLEATASALAATPTLDPSPQGGGRR